MKPYTIAIMVLLAASVAASCSPTPAGIKVDKEKYILEGADATATIKAFAVDADGTPIPNAPLTFFCESIKVIRVTQEGGLKAVSSGEDWVEVEVGGTDLKVKVPVRVKIATGIETTHEKLRLWEGQVKTDVASWVLSEKNAYIEGYLPEWTSEDPTIVSVEKIPDPVQDPKRARSFVKMVGLKSGDTTITTSFNGMSKDISVAVFSETEEVDLAGRRKDANGKLIEKKEEEDDDDE